MCFETCFIIFTLISKGDGLLKKHSTGALSSEQRALQDARYRNQSDKQVYDYLFIGTGNAALTCASLLANAGYKVCMLEAHDVPGGYAHTFSMHGYEFCAQVHYIWDCGEGGKINEFLKQIGLQNDITFELFDEDGYDHMIMPDSTRVKIPYGWESLQRNIEAAYPQTTGLDGFFKVVKAIRKEMANLPKQVHWWDYIVKAPFFPTLMKYRNATVQDLFDDCRVSIEARTILTAQAGDHLLPPNELSVLYFISLLGGYGSGAYYPTRHFKYYMRRLVSFVEEHDGAVYFEEEVVNICAGDGAVTDLITRSGKTFTAKNYICNMDPQAAAGLIGWEHFSKRDRRLLEYDYSDTGVMVYLGLKPSYQPEKYGFGNHNTWHCFDWDMNTMWESGRKLDVEKAWLFISTPTTHSSDETSTPPGGHIMEIGTFTPYAPFKAALDRSHHDYMTLKMDFAERMIDLVVEHHVPDLRDHIEVKVVGSPTTNEDFCLAPLGNAYGSAMRPENTTTRLDDRTPFKNLYWCNASSGSPGIYGTVLTGMNLFERLEISAD